MKRLEGFLASRALRALSKSAIASCLCCLACDDASPVRQGENTLNTADLADNSGSSVGEKTSSGEGAGNDASSQGKVSSSSLHVAAEISVPSSERQPVGEQNAIVAPFGVSTTCGDKIVGDSEECDDGNAGSDACTAACQTRDQPAVTNAAGSDRYQGIGRHPIAGHDNGFLSTFVETPDFAHSSDDGVSIGATLFNIWGTAQQHLRVSDGASPIDDANPVAAALPNGDYAVAWGDFDADGSDLGIALRRVSSTGQLGPLSVANGASEFSQLNPDILWTGTQLVVAWEDYADAENGPDIKYRTFDAQLNPTSEDLPLANAAAPEAAVAMTSFNGGWAAAYREGTTDGQENIVVVSGSRTVRIGPVFGGTLDDRPALVALDASHLLIAFSVGTDPTAIGLYNTARIRYAVVDTAVGAPAPVTKALDPLDDLLTTDATIAQTSPALAPANDGAYLAWRTEARLGDSAGDQVWLKRLPWVQSGGASRIVGDLPEVLLPRLCEGSNFDQRAPALARVGLPPGNALAIGWTDYGKTLGATSGEPDVVIHYAPTHLSASATAPESISESWSGATGSTLPARWTTDAVAPVTWSVQYAEAEFNAAHDPGSSFALVNDHSARDIDLVTTTRLASTTTVALIARADSLNAPANYLAASITTKQPDVWRIYSVVNGVKTDILTFPLPKSFSVVGIGVNVDYRLRFRAVTNADGSLFLGMKAWRVGADEPAAWLLSTTLPTTDPTVKALGNVSGRFGLWGIVTTAGGNRMYFDDFRARFFEGAVAGELDSTPSQYPLLLRRSAATYRRCTADAKCTVADGCCVTTDDCQAGRTCSHSQAAGLGAGSHASVCVASHCANTIKDGDEVRADAGGADCKESTCSSTVALGTAGYCVDGGCECGQGEYPCFKGAGCLPGLICGNDTAELYGGGFQVDACVPPHCVNRVLDSDEIKPDCGGSCGGGDCTNVCPQSNGAAGHCRPYCPCGVGQGHCYQDDDCTPGLVCAARGARFGFASNVNVCVMPVCTNNARDAALGETSPDCGGACGCGGCANGCAPPTTPAGPTVVIPTGFSGSTETFDSIGTAGTATLPSGWRVDKQTNPRTGGSWANATTATLSAAGAAMPNNAANSIYNFGAGVAAAGADNWASASDRAIGWLASGNNVATGGTKSGNLYVQLQAPSTTDIRSLNISYRVEKYRKGTTGPGFKIQLYYSANGTTWASAGAAFTTTYGPDADNNGYDPAPSTTSTSVSGNVGVYIVRNAPFYLAWNYTTSSGSSNDATNAQALAIDDVSIAGVVP